MSSSLFSSAVGRSCLLLLTCYSLVVQSVPTLGEAPFSSLFGRAIGSQCRAPEGTGTCQDKSVCQGIAYPAGLCPNDPAAIQCCVTIACQSSSGSGYCRSVSNNGCSGGSFVSNLCPGSDDIKCCIKAASSPSSAISSPRPTATAAPAPETWPSCRTTLSCSFSEIQRTSLQERLDYVRYMQSAHFGPLNCGNQFRAIEGVIIFFMNKGLGAPGTWVSYVDAAIVEGIQRGGAIALGFSDAQGGNPGSVKWADFMRRMKNNQLGERDAHDYAWSDSEQTSTEYGRRTADSLSLPTTNQTLRWYKFTQIFRWVMRNRQLVVQLIKDAAPFPTGFIISKSAQLIIDWLTNITDATPTICGSDAAWELSELDGVPLSNTGIIQNTGILIKMAFKFAVCIGLN